MPRFVLSVLLLLLLPAAAAAFDLTVVHFNDTHSYLDASRTTISPGGKKTYVTLGGWARMATGVAAIRAHNDNVALLHAGDAVQGGLYFLKYDGKPEMELMNRLGFDAMVLGNHEFDRGTKFLANLLGMARFPVLSANLIADELPKLRARVRPYTILQYGTEKVAILGLTSMDTSYTSTGGKDVRFDFEIETAKQYIAEIQAKGINKIIALTHMGFEMDKKLATEVDGIDLVVGGHTHTLLGGPGAMGALGKSVKGLYPTVVKGPSGNDVYVVTGWKWGQVLPSIHLTFDRTGNVTSAKGNAPLLMADSFKRKNTEGDKEELAGTERDELVALLKASPSAVIVSADQAIEDYLRPYRRGLAELEEEVLGKAATDLIHIRQPNDEHPHGSQLAPLVAESMRWQTIRTDNSPQPGADLALLNAGAVRDSLAEGDISVGDALTIMPFANTLYELVLSGAQIKMALEHGASRGGGAFPYLAGARFEVDLSRPEGDRVTYIWMQDADEGWKPINPHDTYGVVVNSFLANGGDGYDMLPVMITEDSDTGYVDSQVFMDFVKEKGTLKAPVQNGVTLKQ